jgi:drug/metabolite transporter (DMT)-like permease
MEGGGGERAPPKRAYVAIALLAVYLIWGSTYLGIRFVVETMPPLLSAGARWGVAGAALYLVVRARGAPRPPRAAWKPAIVVGAFLLLGGNGLVSIAETSVPSGIAALVVALVPVFVVLFDWVGPSRARPSPLALVGIALGFGGVALLVDPFSIGSVRFELWAMVLLIAASALWSVGTLYGRVVRLPDPPALAMGMEMLGGALCLLVAGVALGEVGRTDPSAFTATSWAALGYLMLVGSLGGFTAYLWLIRNVAPQLATTYAFVNPVIAVMLGAALAAEPVTPRTALAAATIIGAVALITLARAPRRVRPEEPPGEVV